MVLIISSTNIIYLTNLFEKKNERNKIQIHFKFTFILKEKNEIIIGDIVDTLN